MPSAYTPEKVIPTYATITGVGIAFTAARLWVRTRYVRVALAADDFTAFAAVVFVTGAVALQITNALLGTAGDDVKLAESQRQARIALQVNWINPILEAWAFGLIKLSLSFFYRRIFGVWPVFRRINNATIVLLVAYSIAFSFGQLFLCGTNFYLIWLDLDQHTARERCAERGHLQFFFALFSVLTDMLVVGLPLVFVARLQMSTRRKWASAVVFFLGFASTGASIARLVYVSAALKYGWFSFNFKPAPGEPAVPSPIFETLNPTLLATIEMGLGIWGANLPALSPLLRNFHPLLFVSQSYRKLTSLWTSTGTDRRLLATTAESKKLESQ
ncbi:hypothetical protein F5Y12DRAFT_711923 [Xylaria sp. FL1777]|nr:hypothetical protein F5Y12DRAFT_711923 [Xylaria sp. FL1777]